MKKPWLEGIEVVNTAKPESAWSGWLETLALTAAVVAASFATQENDPFRLGGGFSWVVLAPLLAGLRYGFVYGFASALLLLAILGVSIDQQWQLAPEFPVSWSIGIMVVAMVAGEFRDMWGRRLHRLEGAYQYRAERLEEFTRNYQLLRLSHDRLEQTVANSGLSLREGIMHLRAQFPAADGLNESSMQRLIEFVADYGSLSQACIAELKSDRIDTNRLLARIGDAFVIDAHDPVLISALENREMAAINLLMQESADPDRLLAAIPVGDSTGEIHAMLLVKSMPFFAFHENNLKLMAVLVAHAVDHLLFETALPSTARFIASFERVYRDFKEFKLNAMLVKLSGAPADIAGIFEKIRSSLRAIDLVCMTGDKDQPVIWVMLPLTGVADAGAWMRRIDDFETITKELWAIDQIDPQVIRSLEPAG